MSIDFNKEEQLPYVNWVSIRLGYMKASEYENEIQKYGLELEDLYTMSEGDLYIYLSGYGINYLQDKFDTMREIEMEDRRLNGGFKSDDELLDRLYEAELRNRKNSEQNYGYDY